MQKALSIILAILIAVISWTKLSPIPEEAIPTILPTLSSADPSSTGPQSQGTYPHSVLSEAEKKVYDYAIAQGLQYTDYPKELIELLERNPETSQFVLEYPLKKDQRQEIDLSEYGSCDSVPLFMQWDQRWGYLTYGDNVAGLTACGPVCLSMVAYHLTKDPEISPDRIMEFAVEEGYCIPGNGTAWALISEGGRKLGLDVEELPLHDGTMYRELENGWPIICIMGPGDFTTTGHYIVITGLEDGAFRVNDPNSYENSSRLWTYEEICDQINNLWVVRLP